MTKKLMGFLLIATLALVAYASGAVARSAVAFVSTPSQANFQPAPPDVEPVSGSGRSETNCSDTDSGTAGRSAWRLTSRTDRPVFDKLHQKQKSLAPAGNLTETKSLFIAGVLVDGEIRRIRTGVSPAETHETVYGVPALAPILTRVEIH